jgi:hypothetical protein
MCSSAGAAVRNGSAGAARSFRRAYVGWQALLSPLKGKSKPCLLAVRARKCQQTMVPPYGVSERMSVRKHWNTVLA